MKSQDFFEAMHKIRNYFYTIEEQKKFIEADLNHSHGLEDTYLYHNDYHDGEHHVHM